MIVAPKIKKIRELKGFSQEYMAKKLSMSQSSYSRIEKDDNELSFQKLDSISEIFGVKPLDIINFDDKNVFNNSNNEVVINTGDYYAYSKQEKKLYETRITHLEEEVVFLRQLLGKELLD